MSSNLIFDSGRNSITNMIGWLSLCLVAAGWGAELDATIRDVLTKIGLFGLVSMIGLKVVRSARLKKQQQFAESRIKNDLRRNSYAKQTTALLNAELDRLDNEECDHEEIEMVSHSSDNELILLVRHWVQVNPQLDRE